MSFTQVVSLYNVLRFLSLGLVALGLLICFGLASMALSFNLLPSIANPAAIVFAGFGLVLVVAAFGVQSLD